MAKLKKNSTALAPVSAKGLAETAPSSIPSYIKKGGGRKR